MKNPLLTPSTLKHSAIPFSQILPEHFMPALDEAIALARQKIAQVKLAPPSFANTIAGLEQATEELELISTVFYNLYAAHTNDSLQELAAPIGGKTARFENDMVLDQELFKKIETVYEQRQSANLNTEQLRLLEKTYREFQRNGAALDENGKIRLRQIDERLAELRPLFGKNVLKSTNDFELWIENEDDLLGLPDDVRTAAREAAVDRLRESEAPQPQPRWLFTLQAPSYLPFVTYSQKRELREKIISAVARVASQGETDNRAIVVEIVKLKTERAKLLGFETYAHYALADRMAENPQNVFNFLQTLYLAAKPAADRDIKEVQDFAKQLGGPEHLEIWDFPFYSEKLKEQKYSFDESAFRPYLKLENVLAGMFELAHRLYKLDFTKSDQYSTYHEDVVVYEVHREKEFVGLFYADFFPRPTKRGGAWMTSTLSQGFVRNQKQRPHVMIVCNFTKPTQDKPSLLTPVEVTTLFHEFGHALHGLLSQVHHRHLSGTNVDLDFVELPSQLMENWVEQEEALALFAKHYQTGEALPQAMLQAFKASQSFQLGYQCLRQLMFASLDMAWHTEPPPEPERIEEFELRVNEKHRLFTPIKKAVKSTSFGHIFGGGYAAGYYSYKWAEALEADAFELFKEKGIFDRETGAKFEEFILSKGGSDHPMRLYEQFRGRKPDPEALLRRDGLI